MKTKLFIYFLKTHRGFEKKLLDKTNNSSRKKIKAVYALISGFSRAGVYWLS